MTKLSPEELDTLIPSLCTRCGKCCLKQPYIENLRYTEEDLQRWHMEGRSDITRDAFHGELFYLRENCSRCPFVRIDRKRKDSEKRTYSCKIYETRPAICKDYPYDYEQMEQDGCEIIGELEKRGIDARGWECLEKREERR